MNYERGFDMVIATHKIENLDQELEDNVRAYADAKRLMKKLKEDAIDAIREANVNGFDTIEILDRLKQDIDECTNDMKLYKDNFEKTKEKYIAIISNLKIDWEL
jgi:chromosome segregation ATPase